MDRDRNEEVCRRAGIEKKLMESIKSRENRDG